jgi:hypothetical protein
LTTHYFPSIGLLQRSLAKHVEKEAARRREWQKKAQPYSPTFQKNDFGRDTDEASAQNISGAFEFDCGHQVATH